MDNRDDEDHEEFLKEKFKRIVSIENLQFTHCKMTFEYFFDRFYLNFHRKVVHGQVELYFIEWMDHQSVFNEKFVYLNVPQSNSAARCFIDRWFGKVIGLFGEICSVKTHFAAKLARNAKRHRSSTSRF